jgi:hypothetical protein
LKRIHCPSGERSKFWEPYKNFPKSIDVTSLDNEAFFQEQTVGLGFGVPHMFNIMRRVTQSAPGGAINPVGWARALKVAFSSELKARGISGVSEGWSKGLEQKRAECCVKFRERLTQFVLAVL